MASCGAGDVMDDLFSAPKVQIARVVGKFLGNAPVADEMELDCSRQMTEVVSALACFAEHICGHGKGTAVESAEQVLPTQLRHCNLAAKLPNCSAILVSPLVASSLPHTAVLVVPVALYCLQRGLDR